ncbi:MAG: ABC transporter permease [Chloroflexota bacterium]
MNAVFWMRYSIRSLNRSGRRALFAVICVAVGVAGVVALQIASLTVQNALTSNVRAANGGDISITTEEAPLSGSDLAVLRRLRQHGRITQWTAVSTLHATTVSTRRVLVPFDVEVVSAPPFPLGGEPTFVTPGNGHVDALLAQPGNVLVTNVLAQQLGVGVGSRLLVNSIGGRGLHVTVRGVLAQTNFSHSSSMMVQRRDATALNDRSPHYSAVYANLLGSPSAVANSLRAQFPSATVQTVSEALAADQAQVHDFRQFMLMVGLLALLIAGIGTLNAMQSMLLRRRLEIAMLKAMGFGQGTLYALFGIEACIIGLIGGVVGTLVGAIASKVITGALANALALQITYVLDMGTLLTGVVLGIGAALVFAVLPIVRAAGFRPLELLREGVSSTSWSGWPRTVALLVLLMVLFAALAAVTLGDILLAAELVGIAFAAFAVLTAMFSLIVTWLGRLGRPRSRVLGAIIFVLLVMATVAVALRAPALTVIVALAAILWGLTIVLTEERLLPLVIAIRTLHRGRACASVTLVAFLTGILAMSITLTVAVSLRSQINDAIATAGSTNLVAISNPDREQAILRASRSLPGVHDRSDLVIVQTRPTGVNGQSLPVFSGAQTQGDNNPAEERSRLLGGVTGYDLRHGAQPTAIRIVNGRGLGPSDSGTSHVVVRSALMDAPYSIAVGNRITLQDSGTGHARDVQVVGFYTRARRTRGFGSFFTPPVLSDRSLAQSIGGSDAQTVVALSVDPKKLTVDAAALQRAVPGALVVDVGDLAAIVEQILNELLDVLAVITALVLGAGLAVVANGVALAMMERRREIALYKAIGFGPNSVLRFVLVENALVGTLAGAVSILAVALALALISHFALQQAIGFDPVVAVLVMVVATVLAIGTAYLTARTPVRIRPLEALRNE